MPNWCLNQVEITATTDEAKKKLAEVSEKISELGLFYQFRPLPKILEETTAPTPKDLDPAVRDQMIAETGFDNWYEWQIAHWGTKWDIDPYVCDFDGDTLSLCFDSAWDAPTEFYRYLVEQGFEVSASYFEPGMGFAGTWYNGSDNYIEDIAASANKEPEELDPDIREIYENFNVWEYYLDEDDE